MKPGETPPHPLDWGKLAPLRLQARTVADGVYAGTHRSRRGGAGVEFGGHRSYAPGDDLRWLDRRAFLRHGRLLVREFETETDRTLHLVLDASRSMAFRSELAPAAKLAFAALLAAALGRIALASGDPVGLVWLGGGHPPPLPLRSGREAFEQLLGALEEAAAAGELVADSRSLSRAVAAVARRARRGGVVVLLSDLLDLPEDASDSFAALGTGGRTVVAVRVLDPVEARFPYAGPIRFRSSEGGYVVETDAARARDGYLAALEQHAQAWDERLLAQGSRLIRAETDADPVEVVRGILQALRGGRP